MRFAASSIVREAISYAILDIQLGYATTDALDKAWEETIRRYKPIFQDKAKDIAYDVYDWLVAQGKFAGDIESLKRRLFLELWKDERFSGQEIA